MPDLSFINLYVNDPAASAAFYAERFGFEPVQSSPTYIFFATKSGLMLGLWSRDKVEPATPANASGGAEICFTVDDVDAVHAEWSGRGVSIAQSPTTMGFGRTFVALDPHGHRVRVFTPAAS